MSSSPSAFAFGTTNLVNGRISLWAVTKIHPDQAGFVPGRLITDHTRLASEVAHLSNSTGTDGYIVSLDQAKAYNKTDISWLLGVLSTMGIPEDLISLIDNVTRNCRTRVRINSGLSSPFVLNVGLRQGDPLSLILYDFSIEPLGMRMQKHLVGISCCGLPLARLIMYADDMNFVTKLAGGLLFFLPLPYLVAVISLHYTTLHYFGVVFHYSTLLYSTLGRSFHYFTLLYTTGDIILYLTLHMCALWWQVVISLSRLLCGIQPLWLCGPYHDLLCVWELLSCHSLSVRTVVTPFSILWQSSMTCAVRTLSFSFMLTEQLYVCLTLHYPILYFWAACLSYST